MSEKDFFDRFTYDSEKDILGSGGFGTVYRAYDILEKRYVAIKIAQVKDIHGKFTLLNEVELSKGIDDHANVARYELGLRVKYPFLVDYGVMAFYEEGNLDTVLRKKHGILNEKEQFDIIQGLLEGIEHLHKENVVHRDLKLANILMHKTKQGEWRPKIADFGLSRQLKNFDASMENSAIGITIPYAAPEQIANKPIRRNVDLWAFAVIVYRILTGEMPFTAVQEEGADATAATLEMSRKIIQLELPDKLNTIKEPYQTILKQCFVKETKDRAQSAAELLEILRANKSHLRLQKNGDDVTTAMHTQATPKTEDPNTLLQPKQTGEVNTVLLTKQTDEANTVLPTQKADEANTILYPKHTDDDVTTPMPVSSASTKTAPSVNTSPQPNNNKRKAALGLGGLLLCCAAGLGIYKMNQPFSTADATANTVVQTDLSDNQQTVKDPSQSEKGNETATNTTKSNENIKKTPFNTPEDTKKVPIKDDTKNENSVPSDVTPVPVKPEPIVPDKQKEVVKEPIPSPKPDPIVIDKKTEKPPKPTPNNKPNVPVLPSNESNHAPELVQGLNNFMAKVNCKSCCKDLTTGMITIINFKIEGSGKVSFSEKTSVEIRNQGQPMYERLECRASILEAFQKHYRWKTPKIGTYLYGRYDISY